MNQNFILAVVILSFLASAVMILAAGGLPA